MIRSWFMIWFESNIQPFSIRASLISSLDFERSLRYLLRKYAVTKSYLWVKDLDCFASEMYVLKVGRSYHLKQVHKQLSTISVKSKNLNTSTSISSGRSSIESCIMSISIISFLFFFNS